MWAAPPPPSSRWLTGTNLFTSKPPTRRRRYSTAVYNHQNGDQFGAIGISITVAALKPTEPALETAAKQPAIQAREKQLSGADVLMALQSATARKTKRLKGRRDLTTGRGGERNKEAASMISNVRPLCVKPEWSTRLQELETQLQQLMNS